MAESSVEKKSESNINRLWQYKNEGYVFHGSGNADIRQLEPRQARDMDKSNEFNNDNAVYATASPQVSVIFGCVSWDKIPRDLRKDASWSLVWSPSENRFVAKIPKDWQEYVLGTEGFVYVLKGDSFSGDGGWQVKSKLEVVPADKVKVGFEDFEKMGGKIIWKDKTEAN